MNQIDERRYYEDEDEIDLLDILKTVLNYKKMIISITVIFTIAGLIGGYIYNREKTVNSVIVSLEYPGVRDGKNPDGSTFSASELMSLNVVNDIFDKYKNEIAQRNSVAFENSITVKGIIPEVVKTKIKQAVEKGENFTYFPTRYEIYTANAAPVLKELVNGVIENFIIEYRPNTVIDYVPNLDNYDYAEIQTILDDKLDSLRTIADEREKHNFISTKLGYSFSQILSEINTVQNIDLQGLYSYISINGLTVDKTMRETRYNAEIRDLKLKKDTLLARAKVVKQMLEDYKPKEKSFVIPNIGEINGKIDLTNDYYSKLIDEYLSVNNQVKSTEFEIQKIENAKLLIKYPTVQEKKIINEKLNGIVARINKIVDNINIINKEYVRVKYANMIRIDSPVITVNLGKPYYMFLVGGIVIGLFFSLFLVFVSELKKEYKKKYSK